MGTKNRTNKAQNTALYKINCYYKSTYKNSPIARTSHSLTVRATTHKTLKNLSLLARTCSPFVNNPQKILPNLKTLTKPKC